jgi:hypothetical protein
LLPAHPSPLGTSKSSPAPKHPPPPLTMADTQPLGSHPPQSPLLSDTDKDLEALLTHQKDVLDNNEPCIVEDVGKESSPGSPRVASKGFQLVQKTPPKEGMSTTCGGGGMGKGTPPRGGGREEAGG